MALRSTWRIEIWPPCLAQTRPLRALAGGRGDHASGKGELRSECSHLWRASDLARRAGSRLFVRFAQDRTSDARSGAAGAATQARLPKDDCERSASAISPNVLDRQFTADQPNRKWIADFTYVWTAEGWLYVAAVVDLFSPRVVGWSMSASMTAQFVTDALVMAIWRRGKPDALLHHSDRGSQYTSEQFQRLMADNGVICSMSRSGNVWDNAAMESFFSSLKTERTARKVYRTRNEAKADVFDYIECFYNPKRRHSTIGYLSPMEFERRAGLL